MSCQLQSNIEWMAEEWCLSCRLKMGSSAVWWHLMAKPSIHELQWLQAWSPLLQLKAGRQTGTSANMHRQCSTDCMSGFIAQSLTVILPFYNICQWAFMPRTCSLHFLIQFVLLWCFQLQLMPQSCLSALTMSLMAQARHIMKMIKPIHWTTMVSANWKERKLHCQLTAVSSLVYCVIS